jgi:hypothetical protein
MFCAGAAAPDVAGTFGLDDTVALVSGAVIVFAAALPP